MLHTFGVQVDTNVMIFAPVNLSGKPRGRGSYTKTLVEAIIALPYRNLCMAIDCSLYGTRVQPMRAMQMHWLQLPTYNSPSILQLYFDDT